MDLDHISIASRGFLACDVGELYRHHVARKFGNALMRYGRSHSSRTSFTPFDEGYALDSRPRPLLRRCVFLTASAFVASSFHRIFMLAGSERDIGLTTLLITVLMYA